MMALEPEVRGALSGQVEPADVIRFPLVYANRGTFTVAVRSGGRDLAVLRVDAARQLVAHESAALEAVASSGSALASTVPNVIWKGAFGRRTAALQSHMPGNPQPYARTPAGLAQQLDALSPWLIALSQIAVPGEMNHPHLDETLALYRSPEAFAEAVSDEAIAGEFWACVDRLGGWETVMSHGDLHPDNILDSENGFNILDWEYAAARPSAFDWAHYIAASVYDRPGRFLSSKRHPARQLADVVSTDSPWMLTIREATRAHMERLSMDPGRAADYLKIGLWDFLWRRYRYQDYQTLARTLFVS